MAEAVEAVEAVGAVVNAAVNAGTAAGVVGAEATAAPAAAPTKMNDHLPALKEMINKKLESPKAFDILSTMLKNKGAVLAGGSVLQVIAGYETSNRLDLDFYCPTKMIPDFIRDFVTPREDTILFDNAILATQASSFYSASFLRRNGIRKIYRLLRESTSPEARSVQKWQRAVEFAQMIDIMSVRNARNVLDVVKNFDLTFCQVWWDGTDIWATHPEDINQKRVCFRKTMCPYLSKGIIS